MILSPSSEKVKNKLRQHATKDIAPGLNHVQFRENGISFYSPNIFDCAPTMKYQGYFPIFICDLLKVRNCRNIYGSGGYDASSNNIVMLNNHPLQKIMICGKILGEYYHEISAKKAYYSLLVSDGSTGDVLTVKLARGLYMQSFQDTYRNPQRLLSICGEITFFNDNPELCVHYTSQVGTIGDLTTEIKWWELTNQIRNKYLKDPWVFNATINLAQSRTPFTNYSILNGSSATSSFVATDSKLSTRINENNSMINTDITITNNNINNNNDTLVKENGDTKIPSKPDDVDHQLFSETQMYVPKVKFLKSDFSREMKVKKLTREVELIQHSRQIKVRDYDSFKISKQRLKKTNASKKESKKSINNAIVEEIINIDDSDNDNYNNEVDFNSEATDKENHDLNDNDDEKQQISFEKFASGGEIERDDEDQYPVIISEDCFRNSKNYNKLNRYLEVQGISDLEFIKHDNSLPINQDLIVFAGKPEVEAEPDCISKSTDEIITIDSSDIEDSNDLNEDSKQKWIQEQLELERHKEAVFFSESHQNSVTIIRESTFKIELINFFISYPSSKISEKELITYPSILKTCRDIAYCNIVNSSFTEKQYTLLSDRLTEDEITKEEKRIVHNTGKNMIENGLLESSVSDYFNFERIQKVARFISDILESRMTEEREEISCIMKKVHKSSLHICKQDYYFQCLRSLIDQSSFPRLTMKGLSWMIREEFQGVLLTPIEVAEIIKHLIEIQSNDISKYENIACSYGYSVCLLWRFEHTDTVDMEWQYIPIILDSNNTVANETIPTFPLPIIY